MFAGLLYNCSWSRPTVGSCGAQEDALSFGYCLAVIGLGISCLAGRHWS